MSWLMISWVLFGVLCVYLMNFFFFLVCKLCMCVCRWKIVGIEMFLHFTNHDGI